MTRLVIFSDTHGSHMAAQLPDGDILIHCGDFSTHGSWMDALKFVNWLGAQPHKHKIFIAGNHDIFFEQGNPSEIDAFIKTLPKDVHYLNDSGIELEGLKFWGSPVQPTFFNWAFNRDRGPAIKKHWDLIPSDTDVLITHGPAKDICDEVIQNRMVRHVGCADLYEAIQRIQPKLHLFGHIHFSGGKSFITKNTTFINAAFVGEDYIPANKPFIVDINEDKIPHIVHTF